MYIEHPIGLFLDELASREPVPGGGSAAALSGALAAGLVSMVCNLTLGKRRFREAEATLRAVLVQAEQRRTCLSALVQRDTEVYARVMAAHRMPADTEDERAVRDTAWQAALAEAASVPLEIAELCRDVVRLAVPAGQLGNPWAVSDAGAAALMAEAAAAAAGLSVQVNLSSMTDAMLVESYRRRLAVVQEECYSLRQQALAAVQSRMEA